MCHMHRKRKWRKENPIKASYGNLKSNAKRRNKECTITLEYFEKVCQKTEYILFKGRTKDGYSLERDDDEKGYVEGNISVLSVSDNIKKEQKRRKILKHHGQGDFSFKKQDKGDNSDVPF